MAINDPDSELPGPQIEMTPEKAESGEHAFWQDLNPDFLKGENYGNQGPHPEKTALGRLHQRYVKELLN